MKIDLLLPDLRGGGAERVAVDLAHEFSAAGHQVRFLLMRADGELLPEARESFEIADLSAPRVRQILPRLIARLRQDPPDVLLVSMWPLTALAAIVARVSVPGCRVIVSEHGILSGQYRDRGRLHRIALRLSLALGYRLADRRVGVSAGVAQDMAELARMPLRQFEIIHNPVPASRNPAAADLEVVERSWSTPRGARILTVGRMKPVKNQALLLRAFARLDRTDARLMIVGDGEGRNALLSLAQDLGIGGRVLFAGFRADPSPFYRTADLFALSSDREGFGNVIVEALAFGLPVVSTDCPSGPREILDGGRFGRLVPPGDVAALSSAIAEALASTTDPDLLKRRAAEFAPEIAARKYLELMTSP